MRRPKIDIATCRFFAGARFLVASGRALAATEHRLTVEDGSGVLEDRSSTMREGSSTSRERSSTAEERVFLLEEGSLTMREGASRPRTAEVNRRGAESAGRNRRACQNFGSSPSPALRPLRLSGLSPKIRRNSASRLLLSGLVGRLSYHALNRSGRHRPLGDFVVRKERFV